MVAPKRASQKKQPGFLERHDNIYLFVPNLIGYARIGFALYAFAIALRDPTQCFLAYFFSFVCDELDGRFARMFNQTSTLGAVLDMVTDRVATTCLLAILCILYPSHHVVFLSLIMLDIFSHWFQMYSTLATGSSTHKDVHSKSFIVRFYYQHRMFMGFCCVCCEVLYLCVYLLHWEQYRSWGRVPLPAALRPHLNGLLPAGGVPGVALLALVALPGTAIKQMINVVQMRAAMALLVLHDRRKERR